MTKIAEKPAFLSRLLRERAGNFAMVTAVVIPVILAAGGIAIDLTKIVLAKAELQDASDAAALAAASALANDKKSVAEAKIIAAELFALQMSGNSGIVKEGDETLIDAAPIITVTETAIANSGKAFKVDVASTYSVKYTVFTKLLGHTKGTLSAASTAESQTGSKNAISMFLVLDRSASMTFKTDDVESYTTACQNWTDDNWGGYNPPSKPCYVRKVAALKTAVATLVNVLNTADPNQQYVRTGAISYNNKTQEETPLAWGTAGAFAYVNDFPAQTSGGTDSHTAFANAVSKLRATKSNGDNREDAAHKKKTGLVPVKYLLFMTDGENTSFDNDTSNWGANESDKYTLASCQTAKDNGILVYTVAFMAPTRGQKLLRDCATTPANYYEAKDQASLIAAFNNIGQSAASVVSRLTN